MAKENNSLVKQESEIKLKALQSIVDEENENEILEISDGTRFTGEFVGMIMFVLTIGYSSSQFGLYFGAFLAQSILAPISGAHFNPNVSIAQYLCFKKYSIMSLVYYIFVQVLGAGIACLIANYICDSVIAPVVNDNTSNFLACLLEFIFGGWLIFINLLVNSPETSPSTIGFVNVAFFTCCLFCNVRILGKYTGASMNPAIAFSGNIFRAFLFNKGDNEAIYNSSMRSLYINTLAPFCGMLVASFFFSNYFEKAYGEMKIIAVKKRNAKLNMQEAN